MDDKSPSIAVKLAKEVNVVLFFIIPFVGFPCGSLLANLTFILESVDLMSLNSSLKFDVSALVLLKSSFNISNCLIIIYSSKFCSGAL